MAHEGIEKVVVPGTFDPVTLGHLDVISRARRIAPHVVVAVAASAQKHGVGTSFALGDRVALVRESLDDAGLADVEAKPLEGLLVDFCHEVGAQAVVKGLREAADFEYELQQAAMNQILAPDIESIFVMSKPKFGFVSSSVVREIASLGGDVSPFVPACVLERLRSARP